MTRRGIRATNEATLDGEWGALGEDLFRTAGGAGPRGPSPGLDAPRSNEMVERMLGRLHVGFVACDAELTAVALTEAVASGAWGGRCASLADYVIVTGLRLRLQLIVRLHPVTPNSRI